MRKCIAGRLCPADGYEEVYCSRGMPDGSVRQTVMRKCIVAGCMPDGSVRWTVMRKCIVAGVCRTALSGRRL